MSESTTESIEINASPSFVFDVAADIEHYPTWAADIKAITVDERDGLGRAETVTFRAAAFGRSTTYALRYDYCEAPKALSWVQVAGDLTDQLDGRYLFEATDHGVLVTYSLEVSLSVPIPGFVKSRAQNRIQSTALRELKARAESLS